MKPLFLILGLVLAVGAGALGGSLVATSSPTKHVESLQPQVAALQPAVAVTPEVAKRLEALSMEISALETQIAALREERSRTPAVAVVTPERAPIADDSTEAFAAMHREAILKVLADERAEQDRKREEDRKQREEQQLANRADRVAQRFNLNDAQKRQLTDYYGQERQKFDELRAQFRDSTATTDVGPGTPRDAFREARDWRTNELTRLFGTDLGAQINEFETDRVRGGAVGGGGARRQGAGAAGGGAGRAGGNQSGTQGDGAPAGPPGPRPGGGF